jgi:predicted HicB family RNase H-like nuclease
MAGYNEKKSVRLPEQLYKRAVQRAARSGVSFSEYVRQLITKDCDRNGMVRRKSEGTSEAL